MIKLEDLEILKDKVIYDTDNDTYVLYGKNESSINAVDFKILGMLNGYSYSYNDHYLVKSTLEQTEISRIRIEVEVGVFREGLTYAYFYKDNTVTQVTEDLDITWSKTFDDNIRNITVDIYGDIYILFWNSRVIRKITNAGEYILYLNDSDDPSKYSRLYASYISEGGGHLYVIGSEFWDNRALSFVDHYDVRKCKRIDRNILKEENDVELDDQEYEFIDIFVDNDYIYTYNKTTIEKLNIKLRKIWSYIYSIDGYSDTRVTFDDKKFKNRAFYCINDEGYWSTPYFKYGKIDLANGDSVWSVTIPVIEGDIESNLCIYKSEIYMTLKESIAARSSYVLALDNDRVLFETRDGNLVRIVETNYDAIFDPDNYDGRYLLGDEIKPGVMKTITYNLLHDTGEVITEDGLNILLEEPNEDYRNPENYNFFRLIGSEVTDHSADYTCIETKDGKMVLSFNNSYIETLFPYTPEESYQYIVSNDGSYISTDQDKDLIRARGIFTNEFYILADSHKFFQCIVTKKDGKAIITKKRGNRIVRKLRLIHRYVVRRLQDIDIIVEHLKENGILDSAIPHYVDRLRHNTTHMIEDMQKALSPTYFNLGCVKKYGYRYDGYDYPLRVSKTQIFMCKNLPYIKKRYTKSIYIEPLAKLIENEEMTPFLLFLNGKAVKWSDIIVVRDWFFSYLIISNNADESTKLEAVLFPCVIRYGEDNSILSDCTTGLYFDSEGKYTKNTDDIVLRMEVLDKDVTGVDHNISLDAPYIRLDYVDDTQITQSNNIFAFEDGYFFGDSRFYLDYKGQNFYTYARDISTRNVVFKSYYFNKANESKNMELDIPNREMAKEMIKSKITYEYPQENISPVDNFIVPFDFKYTFDKSYLENISEATRYILKYKMQLLVDFYRDQSNIKYYTFEGERILTLASKNGGYLVMPRQKNNGLFDYIMVFKNDHLYEYYQEIEYENRVFKIPIFSHVTRKDKIEIVHFKNVDNRYSTLTINDKEDYIEYDLRHDNFLLFGNSYSGKRVYDKFNVENCIQYDIDFEYDNNFNEYGRYVSTNISLSDHYYDDKLVNICSKRQFHYMFYNVLENDVNRFDLEPEFRFCHQDSQYMVFVNGIKLNRNDFEVEYMNNENHLDKVTVILSEYLNKGDRIHIFYLPESYDETIINLKDSTNKLYASTNTIIMDVSELDYTFDSELFIIFVDGKKVLVSDIQNISANRVRIKTGNLTNNSEVCICRYLNPDKILQKVFSYGDSWTSKVDNLEDGDYKRLFVNTTVDKWTPK